LEKVTTAEILHVLRKYWRYESLRPGQDQAISSILSGRDTLLIMPTGGGKSICYQVPAMLLPGITIVISPLISLMKDQVDTLDEIGLPATFVNSTLSGAEMSARLDAAARGDVKLVYVAPERFESASFQERVRRLSVSLLAVDEAHCVSQWGHDFRPSYLRIARAREMVGSPPVAALTATATGEVRTDIVRQLQLRDPFVLVTGFDRRNLTYHVLRAHNDSEKDRLLLRLLRGREGSAIVYAATRKNVDALTELTAGVGLRAVGYHAGLPDTARKRIQDAFMAGDASIVVATNAFGMGIDKPDVRLVVHYNMPGSLEAYYQEAGRAGRDGQHSDCVLLHAYADRFTHEFFINQTYPPRTTVETVLRELRKRCDDRGMVDLTLLELARQIREVKGDRQLASALRILNEYGLVRQITAGAMPGPMVRLLATPERIRNELAAPERAGELQLLRRLWKFGGGEALYRGVELAWRTLAELAGGRSRAELLLERLQAEGFLGWQQQNLGEGIQLLDRNTPIASLPVDWRAIDARRRSDERKLKRMQGYAYHQECRRGYVLRYFGDPAAMQVCGACDNCLKTADGGPLAAAVGEPDEAPPTARGRSARRQPGREPGRGGAQATPAGPELDEVAEQVFALLKRTRADLAQRTGLPPYFVFNDATLRALARQRPATPEQMLDVPGVGARSLERYGLTVLNTLRAHAGLAPLGELPAQPAPRAPRAPRDPANRPSTQIEAARFARLRALRSELARREGLPAYCIFHDRTLVEIARTWPTSASELQNLPGIGPAKLEKYGEALLRLLQESPSSIGE
jgi:ATP-dependent DNA helicase RecQ